MKIQITEKDITRMVNETIQRLNEAYDKFHRGNDGGFDDNGDFIEPEGLNLNDDDYQELYSELKPKLMATWQKLVDDTKREGSKIDAWMDKKGITDPNSRKKIKNKLMLSKNMVFPDFLSMNYYSPILVFRPNGVDIIKAERRGVLSKNLEQITDDNLLEMSHDSQNVHEEFRGIL